jgi:phosphopantothenoylcysteine synthetase/decarboxylase
MKVTVGVSGGIAAYKAAELVRALQKHALDVHVVMTEAAQHFVQPLTFATLSGHKVISSMWETPEEPDGDPQLRVFWRNLRMASPTIFSAHSTWRLPPR